MHAQIVLFDGFDPLDVIAPFEVLAAGSEAVGGELEVELVSAEGPRPVVSGTRGMVFQATAQLDPAKPGYRKIYTYTSEPVTGAADFTVPKTTAFNHQSVVAEWQASATNPDIADPATRREVLRIDEPQSNHNGGKVAFRPGEQ